MGLASFLRSPRKRAPLYPGGVGTLVEVISATKSLTLSQKCYVLCVRLRLWTEGFIESKSSRYEVCSVFAVHSEASSSRLLPDERCSTPKTSPSLWTGECCNFRRKVVGAVEGCPCFVQCSGGPQNSPFEMELFTLRLCISMILAFTLQKTQQRAIRRAR